MKARLKCGNSRSPDLLWMRDRSINSHPGAASRNRPFMLVLALLDAKPKSVLELFQVGEERIVKI
jgi:hypothetical protein